MFLKFNSKHRSEKSLETMTERGARELANVIRAYWRQRGYMGIETRLETEKVDLPEGNLKLLFFVRSNIGPKGFPPRAPVSAVPQPHLSS